LPGHALSKLKFVEDGREKRIDLTVASTQIELRNYHPLEQAVLKQ
jgi:hypothetical protein